jgi:carboxyl-terminal processing protease
MLERGKFMHRWQFSAASFLLSFTLLGCSGSSPVSAPVAVEQSIPSGRVEEEVRPDVPGSLPRSAAEIAVSKAKKPGMLADNTTTPAKRKKARNGEIEEVKRSYEELLKKPATLGFTPTEGLYRNIYFHARNAFVENVAEPQLTQGLVKELKNFLAQAKVDPAPLKQLEGVKPVDAFAKVQELFKGTKVDPTLLGYATMNGLLDGLKDNYSVILTPEEWGKMEEQLNSKEFGGIGIYIELDRDAGNQLTVFEPIEGTPAYKAGLMSGDRLLKIDGKTTKGVTLDVAQTMIRGLEGTNVVLTIERDGVKKDFTVTRGKIHVVSVTSRMFPGQVGYVRLRAFGSDTGAELEGAVSRLKEQGAKSLILDLRNNGGGYIDASVDVVGEFAPKNTLVVYTIDRNGRRREYRSTEQGGLGLPSVVMINEFSASASEITAGALRDHKLATLVGDHSFGKGSVQQLYNLDMTSGKSPRLKLTVARFYTPGGSVIDREGIEPQVVVDMEPRYVGKVDKDIQLKKAVEMLGGQVK